MRRFVVSESSSPRAARSLLLESADLRQLRLRLLGLRLLVPEALDEALEPGDVLGDAVRGLLGGRGPRRLLAPPGVPGPGEVVGAAGGELEHGGRHGLEEPAVVGDEDDRRIERRELVLEPLEALDVEVVRRLVEQQQVGVDRERAREGRAGQLSAGEARERPVEVLVAEAEAAKRPRGTLAPGPATRVLELPLRVRVAPQRPLVVRAGGHLALEAPELLLECEQVLRPRDGVLAQREVELARRALVVERDARALGERQLAALERDLARDRAEQRRLAGPVRARERQAVALSDRERHPVEEGVAGELLAQVGCDQDGHFTCIVVFSDTC